MKKLTLAAMALTVFASGSAFATNPCDGAELDLSGKTVDTYEYSDTSCTVEIKGKGDKTFIRNDFEMNVSSGVQVSAQQSELNMAVAAGAVKGRYVYTGHSNGGSVSQCNDDAYKSTDVDETPAGKAENDLEILNQDGCTNKPALAAAP